MSDIVNLAKTKIAVAVLDDYQAVSQTMADWSKLEDRANITVFTEHLSDESKIVARLLPFQIVCVMRERTPLTRTIIEQLPNLKLIASTGGRNASIDLEAAAEHGVEVKNTGYSSSPTIELTWALILASARNIVGENTSLRSGGWQVSVGDDLSGKTLGLVGLGNIGGAVAKIGIAFGMKVWAWSENLTSARANEVGAQLVTKEEIFGKSDVVSVHLVLSDRSRGLIGANELALMKPSARLINTSRGPIINQEALLAALIGKQFAGAAIDVFDVEPLPPDHPFRNLDNVLATPHIGYVSKNTYETFYGDTVSNIAAWLDKNAQK